LHFKSNLVFINSRNWDRHKFEFVYRIVSLTREKLVLKARTVCVCYDLQAGRAVPLPQKERMIMESYEGADLD
jgi:acyl-CoA thioesterase FadM